MNKHMTDYCQFCIIAKELIYFILGKLNCSQEEKEKTKIQIHIGEFFGNYSDNQSNSLTWYRSIQKEVPVY